MKIRQIFSKIDERLENLSKSANKDSTNIPITKYKIASAFMAFIFVIVSFFISWMMSAEIMLHYCMGLLLFWTLTLTGFFFIRKPEPLIFVEKIGTLLITFYFVARMGGFFTCGGIFMVGLAPIFFTLIFRDYRLMFSVYALFFISICLLMIYDTKLPGKDLLTLHQNLTFFSINFLGITSYVFIFTIYARNILTNLERREADRQKEIHEAKTRLYTNITHEFRTPLTVIMGIADSFKNNNHQGVIHEKADTIIRNGKNLLQLVDQMLEMSKLESRNLCINKVHGNIIPFLRYVFQLQEYHAKEKKLEFHFQAEQANCELDFDPEKISTIVSNLLSNAIKFTPPGGKIRMQVGTGPDKLVIRIIDNGIGIPEDQREKIFDRFYQVDDKDTRKAGGAGIGLSITRELVNLLGGTLELESKPGKETTFTVGLPIINQQSPDIDTTETGDEYLLLPKQDSVLLSDPLEENIEDTRRLLIIEDNRDVVNFLKDCFNGRFMIDVAWDGKQGHQMALETIPDLIVSDIMMPELDGFSLCKKLKDDYRTSHIPIILLTAKADMPSRIQGFEQGADAYIVKPFNQQELLARINNLLDLRRKLYKRYSNGNPSDTPDHPVLKREDQFYIRVRDHILRNLHDENYNVQSLCEEMAMSKSQLYRKFQALTNLSAARFIRKLRMERARHLLLTTSMNISEISCQVGIKTLSTFSELFKEEFGHSPREYIHHYQENHN